MEARLWSFAAAFLLVIHVSGCQEEPYTPTPPEPTLTLTADETQVAADGNNTVTITVTNTAGGQTVLTTERGTFPGGVTSVTLAEATTQIALTTCDAEAVTSCAGTFMVRATAGTLQSSLSIQFRTLDDACRLACSASDTGCIGRACLYTSGSGTCAATFPSNCVVSSGGGGGGGGGGSGPALTVTPERTRLPATGSATTEVVVHVTDGASPTANVAVSLSTTAGSISPTTGTTDSSGNLTVTFSAGTAIGVATITATSTTPALSGTAAITIPRLGAFHIPDQATQYTVQGVKGSGWRELGWLQVQLLDENGQPYPDGLTVRFEHRPLGGSTFSEPLVTAGSCTTWTGCVRYDATTASGGTDSAGLATAWIYSGTVAGALETVVSATAGGVTRTAVLPTVAVVGAKASGSSFSVVCSPLNVPALAETGCSTSSVDEPFTCVALANDRFGNVLGRATQVIFGIETSKVFPVTTTPQYDPASAAPQDLGTAVQRFETLGAFLPFDVAPQAGETSVTHGFDGCGSRVHNPRDGVVTIIAIADGEEAFFDANGNGVYDAGEPFVDAGEPFVDIDDNGRWDAGEEFFDRDGNRAYTPRNGTWDANTKIWTQTVVVYTGAATTMTIPGVAPAPDTYLGTRWAAGAGTGSCTATPQPAAFSLAREQAGPPVVPGGSAWYTVVASDMNLNQVHMRTSYGVSLESGELDVAYYGLPGYADDLGFFYRYWPCNQAATPECASQCRSTTSLPCVMTPSLSGFGCGIAADVKVTCGTTAGSNRVDFTVQTPYERYGTGKNVITTKSITGACN